MEQATIDAIMLTMSNFLSDMFPVLGLMAVTAVMMSLMYLVTVDIAFRIIETLGSRRGK